MKRKASTARKTQKILPDGLQPSSVWPTTIDGRAIAETVRQVRENHIAFSLEEMTIGAASVAAPIFGAAGEFVASLAVVVRSTTNVRALAAAVRTAALGVTRQLAQLHVPPGGKVS